MFHVALILLFVGAYLIVQYYIIPNHFDKHPEKGNIASYTSYALTAVLALLGVGTLIAEHLDELSQSKKRR